MWRPACWLRLVELPVVVMLMLVLGGMAAPAENPGDQQQAKPAVRNGPMQPAPQQQQQQQHPEAEAAKEEPHAPQQQPQQPQGHPQQPPAVAPIPVIQQGPPQAAAAIAERQLQPPEQMAGMPPPQQQQPGYMVPLVPGPQAPQAPQAPAAEAAQQQPQLQMKNENIPLVANSAEASKVVEGIDEDKITAEIEDLQHKLGDLQSNIDKVLQEGKVRRRRKRSAGKSEVQMMSEELDEILETVGN